MWKSIIEKTLPTLIATLVTSLVSKLNYGNWITIFIKYPIEIVFCITIVMIATLVYSFFRYRYRLKSCYRDCRRKFPKGNYLCGKDLTFSGVNWRLRVDLWDTTKIHIELPPRCPTCDTQLIERPRWISGYTWYCPDCDFSISTSKTCWQLESAVIRIAEKSWETEQQSPAIPPRNRL